MTRKITIQKTAAASLRMLCCLFLLAGMWTTNANAQINNSESFDGVTFVPSGWSLISTSGTAVWARTTSGNTGFPSVTVNPQSGAGEAWFNSYNASTGVKSLVTPVIDLTNRGVTATNISFWMYRDNGYNTTADKVQVIYNTAISISGGTLLGTINRAIGLAPVVGANGWYQYTFAVPAGYTGSTNYLVLKATSAYGNNMFVDDVAWQSFPNVCSTPAPGNTVSTLNPVCSGQAFTLSLQNATSGSGVTYQWYKNAVLVGGATNSTYATSQTAAAVYYCAVTCSTGPSTGNSNNVTVTMNANTCTCPTYCTPAFTSYDGTDAITSVSINGWTRTSSGTAIPCYDNQTGLATTTLTSGSSYTIDVSAGSDGSQNFAAWIDFNQNGSFLDAGENILPNVVVAPSSSSGAISFTVPPGALVGTSRLRIVDRWLSTALPCNTTSYGEAEDYCITIVAPAPCSTPTPGNTLPVSPSVCAGGTVNLSLQNATAGTGVTYQWYNSGGAIGGATLATYTTPALFAGETYHCDVTCSSGPSTVSSNNTTVSIASVPVGGTATGPSTGLTYQNLAYSVTGYTGSLQWQYSTTAAVGPYTDIPAANAPTLNISANGAGTYYVRCKAFNAGCTDAFSTVVTTVVTVAGDNVCAANVLSLGANGPYTNVGATSEAGEVTPPAGTGADACLAQDGWCSTGYQINSVWFTYTPVVSGKYSFRLNPTMPFFDSEFALYSASACSPFGGFTLIAANDDSGTVSTSPFGSYIQPVCLTGGTTYYFLVDGYSTTTLAGWGILITKSTNVAPVIAACPTPAAVCNTAGLCSGVVSWSNPTATDECGGATVACAPASGSAFPAGTSSVICTATDAEGATSTCSFSVTVNDCEAPVITVPATDMTVECDGLGNTAAFNQWLITDWGNADATDNCNSAAQLDNYWVNNYTSFNYTCGGNVGNSGLVAFQVYDYPALNYSATTSATFYIVDTQAPVIGSCPGNISQCDNHVATWNTPSVTDVCGATVACLPASGSTFAAGNTTVTCTATDCGGNTDACSFTVTINEAPVIAACPADITSCNPVVTFTDPSATGTPAAVVTCAPPSGSTFNLGSNTVICTATNSCGSSSCSFDVFINTLSTPATSVTGSAPYDQLCYGGTVTLTANGGSLGTGASWKWYEGGCGVGPILGTGPTFTVTPITVGNHQYCVRAEGPCAPTTCQCI
ncbi:MAG: HYR domain-containing protein, partial [Bacteroidota bacterium]